MLDFIAYLSSRPWVLAAGIAAFLTGAFASMLAYWYVSRPGTDLKKLNANRIYHKALRVITPVKRFKITNVVQRSFLLPAIATEKHFGIVGQRLTQSIARTISQATSLRERIPGTVLDVEYNVIFEYPSVSLPDMFSLCETAFGTRRIISRKELPYCLCFKSDDGCWHVKNEGKRRVIFDMDGNLKVKETLDESCFSLLE